MANKGTGSYEELCRIEGTAHGSVVEGSEAHAICGVDVGFGLKELFHNYIISKKKGWPRVKGGRLSSEEEPWAKKETE